MSLSLDEFRSLIETLEVPSNRPQSMRLSPSTYDTMFVAATNVYVYDTVRDMDLSFSPEMTFVGTLTKIDSYYLCQLQSHDDSHMVLEWHRIRLKTRVPRTPIKTEQNKTMIQQKTE